jgi:hypothetical protein
LILNGVRLPVQLLTCIHPQASRVYWHQEFNKKSLFSLKGLFLMFFLKGLGIIENIIDNKRGGDHPGLIQLIFGSRQLFILFLQFSVTNQSFIDLLRLAFRSLVVKVPDQVVLGKCLYHRQY